MELLDQLSEERADRVCGVDAAARPDPEHIGIGLGSPRRTTELSPVTGTPACWGYFATRSIKAEIDTMPMAFLETASWIPVAAAVGLV